MARTRLAPLGFGREASDLIDLALVALGVGGAVLALVLHTWWIAIAAALPSLVAEIVRVKRWQRLQRLARRILLDRPGRSLVRNGMVVAVVCALPPATADADLAALLLAVMAVHLAHTAYSAFALRFGERESTSIVWRNLDVDGDRAGPAPLPDAMPAPVPLDGLRALAAAEVLVLVGAVLAALGIGRWQVPLGAAAAVVGALVVLVGWRAWAAPFARAPRDTDSRVVEAVRRLAPEVVFYFSSPASGTYALTVWADVINAMRRPVLVLVREPVHLDALGGITAPLVVAPTALDLVRVAGSSVRVVLYPTNVVRNNEMIRVPGPMHCFIGHGDSDKLGSFSPLNRMYDEIWVAGRAAIDRYAAVDEGIDLDVIRAVGRPQLQEIRRAVPKARGDSSLVVLYAPTWEGFFDLADYSSVAAMGERIARGVLDAGGTLLFKPHPLTGHRVREAGRARREIEALIRRAGGGSRVVENRPNALYDAFNEADLLISDISSVITDFLASRKPYAVTNRRDVPEAEFRAQFPSAGAAELLGRDLATLPVAIADARGEDPRRAARAALAEYLLGDQHDPLEAFLGEIDAFVARSAARAGAQARS